MFLQNMTLEIHPVRDLNHNRFTIDNKLKHPHMIKRVNFANKMKLKHSHGSRLNRNTKFKHSIRKRDADVTNPTIEIAYFVEETYYDKFANLLGNDRKQIREMLEIYLNGVQAIYHHPSLAIRIDFIITEIYKIPRKSKFLGHIHNATQLLPAFCNFQKQVNYPNDTFPKYWDIAVLLTGENLTALSKIDESSIVGGQANLDTICEDNACAIVDFGAHVTYVIAHEIGHVYVFFN